MIAVLAEKPSVAREIATVLGATKKNDGYLEGNGYVVTWAFGHLIELAAPAAYGYIGFKADNLPILPDAAVSVRCGIERNRCGSYHPRGYKVNPDNDFIRAEASGERE